MTNNSKKDFSDYRHIWVFAEQREGKLMNVALELLGEGARLAGELGGDTRLCAVLIGDGIDHLAQECFEYGAQKVYLAQDPLLKNYTTDGYAKVMSDLIDTCRPEIVFYGATHIGRDLAPRVAGRCNTGLTADCTRLDINMSSYIAYAKANTTLDTSALDENDPSKELKQTRPAFGGNLMATIVCPNTRPQMSTVRPGVMQKAERKAGAKGETVLVNPKIRREDIRTEVVETVRTVIDTVSLTDAEIVCSGGRGLKDKKGFALMEEFAKKVGGVVGASRAAVEAGWIDQSRQVGQTGSTVRPRIYFACGISGAIQHLAGIHDKSLIVAINTDEGAPIFEAADIKIVGDLYKIIPAIMDEWDRSEELYEASLR